MNYTKSSLTFTQQAQRLIARGLIVENPQDLENYLSQVNYYRLSGYWYVFKQENPYTGEESFKPGTTFEMVRDRYEFDRRLRLLLLDAIERIEVAIFRTQLVEANTMAYGPFGYAEKSNYNPKFESSEFSKLLSDIRDDENRSYEEFVKRYRTKYIKERYLPLWMVAEFMSFGQLLTLYRNQHLAIKQSISHRYQLYPMVLDSWLLVLNTIRNMCAHHNRIWNRPLPLPARLPDRRKDPRWYVPDVVPENRLYTALTFTNYLLGYIVPNNPWKQSVKNLLAAYPDIPLAPMGIPETWQDSPLWK
jgi:abortive infection bacteriophage resistance protein